MTKSKNWRVFILGAGFSIPLGYPSANGFISHLKNYANQIKDLPTHTRIAQAIANTISLFEKNAFAGQHALTIDQLVRLILQGRCDQLLSKGARNHVVAGRIGAIREARLATSASLLALEEKAMQAPSPKHTEFIQNIFREAGSAKSSLATINAADAQVLSFNYDRVFELQFFKVYGDQQAMGYHAHSDAVLNSGLFIHGMAQIKSDRFCFLKLHGSIDYRIEDPLLNEQFTHQPQLNPWSPPVVDDNLFFPPHIGHLPPEFLIVFPWEKDFILDGADNALAFRNYVASVWSHAEQVIASASEIFIVGYSFSDRSDSQRLIKLLMQANVSRKIVIQNTNDECERICKMLKNEHDLPCEVKPYASTL